MNDWIDEHLVQQEARSMRGWRRRAVGVPVEEALGQIPRRGLLQTWMPIEAYRSLQAHIRARGMSQAAWFRRAVIAAYLAEGGERETARQMADIATPGFAKRAG